MLFMKSMNPSFYLYNARDVSKQRALQPKVMNSEELVGGSRRSSRTTCR